VASSIDWRAWGLRDNVLAEPIPGTDLVAVWVPTHDANKSDHWERIWATSPARSTAAPGIISIRAASISGAPAKGFLAKWLGRSGRPWILPNGLRVEQIGQRRTDLLLLWAENNAPTPLHQWVQSQWSDAGQTERIGTNLWLVRGVPDSGAAKPVPGPPGQINTASTADTDIAVAERLLAEARATGSPERVASALADLGAAYLYGGNAEKSIATLAEALKVLQELPDRSRQSDILGNLGLVTLAAGHPGRALEIFQKELTCALEANDRYAEKMARERIGLAHAKLNRHAQALESFEQALQLARELGHRKHQADLHWYVAIEQAALDQREQALLHGQSAIDLMKQMRNPQAGLFADHLRKYRAGESAVGQTASLETASPSYLGDSVVAGLLAASGERSESEKSPGLLRMALSAAKSMTKFAGSGFKLASAQVVQGRLAVCASCQHHTGLRCRLCGCFTSAKARLDHEECPIGKWSG
jgi:tetratricopeptide (TPR) repeat protein